MNDVVKYEVADKVAWLTIDRPEARNALSKAVRDGLWAGFRRFAADDDAAVLILTAAGEKAFCAGGDLKEMSDNAMQVPPPDFLPYLQRSVRTDKPVIAAVNGVAFAGGFLLAQMCDLVIAADDASAVLVLTGAGEEAFCAGADLKEMAELKLEVPPPDFAPYLNRNIEIAKPVIAAVNGAALAGGFLLAQMCDLCVAADHAKFAITEARVGRGSPWAAPLPWLIGPRAAMEIMVTATPITAQRAYELGLVNRVVPGEELRVTALEMASGIAANAPLSVRAAKALVYLSAEHGWSAALEAADALYEPVYMSDDAQEGPRSFKEKRAPEWQGR